jgi:hypothetical protein
VRNGQAGIALVITLILLAVITFMAVTFLVVTRGERSNVTSITEQTTSRLAADAALEVAKAELIAPMLAQTNASTVSLIVSTNYHSPYFTNGIASILNVNYDVDQGGGPLTPAESLQNLANLFYLPRVPVVVTNRLYGSNEFRFYIDLNRNGKYDTNGLVALIGKTGGFVDAAGNPSGSPVFVNMTGDPEWVGMPERGAYDPALLNGPLGKVLPEGYAHSSSNRFVSRYAFIVVPVGTTLDINNIHNYAKSPAGSPAMPNQSDRFLRNMGAGSWEMNLAAFLADLNTNEWSYPAPLGTYQYNWASAGANSGVAFDDAETFLRYRYSGNASSLDTVRNMFGPIGATAFASDEVDGYSAGPVMTGFEWTSTPDNDSTLTGKPWSGADNTNHFFDTQDFFDPNKAAFGVASVSNSFVSRLLDAGASQSTYDRYTFFRMLSQLGTDSAPETPKMNINYTNIDASGRLLPNLATNFGQWDPVKFFTNAAVRLLADTYKDTNVVMNGQIHIQIYPTNYYLPSVHRMLQLAANIYDATTNRTFGVGSNGFPSVFRPQFANAIIGGRKAFYITGYSEVTNADIAYAGTAPTYLDFNDPKAAAQVKANANIMFYGVPMVVGAKKGFPNFNEFSLVNDAVIARRLIFRMNTNTGVITETNQEYTLQVTNRFGVETWNSYSNAYPNGVLVYAASEVGFGVTNQFGAFVTDPTGVPLMTNMAAQTAMNMSALAWSGYPNTRNAYQNSRSFVAPLVTNATFLPYSVFSFNRNQFQNFGLFGSLGVNGDTANFFPLPHWYLNLTNRVRVILVDTTVSPNRVIDYVNLSTINPSLDLMDLLNRDANMVQVSAASATHGGGNVKFAGLFDTNRISGSLDPRVVTYGINYQMMVSDGDISSDAKWDSYNGEKISTVASGTNDFHNRMNHTLRNQEVFSAPFSPQSTVHQYVEWQANDPLVHYTTADLTDRLNNTHYVQIESGDQAVNDPTATFAGWSKYPLNNNFRPWNGSPKNPADTTPPTNTRLEIKDSLVSRSDDWDFPTNKLPNIGWLGRIHRGTPWQTINLKAISLDTNTWALWSGHIVSNWDNFGSVLLDGINSHPTNDFRIFDLFTTSFNDNASRGQLSVNQSGLPAWSAVLSGLIVNTNSNTNSFVVINPAGIYNPIVTNSWTPLVRIVDGINRTRANGALFPNLSFNHVGDVLYTPELTLASPFFVTNNPPSFGDEVYERIPQQIMSLLRNDSTPRFIVYSFGQALKPAEHSIYLGSGPFFGMVTNYQITAETATRAVVHVEGAPTSPHVVVDSFNVLPPY